MSHQPVDKTKEELERSFRHAFSRLKLANTAFDSGDNSAAGTIAVNVYALVHDASNKQPSALSLVGRKINTRFMDSARRLSNNGGLTTPLCGVSLCSSGTMRHMPLCEFGKSMEAEFTTNSFADWWRKDILQTEGGAVFTRERLVMLFRHEQAAHVSGRYTSHGGQKASEFAELSRGGGVGWVAVDQEGVESKPVYGPEYPSIRQIGWEVERTIDTVCKDILSAKEGNVASPMRPVEQ